MALHFARDEFAARQRRAREGDREGRERGHADPRERGCNPIDREYGAKFDMTALVIPAKARPAPG
jgi:hypothetical protein